jgi:hypothetical protein
MKIFFYIRFSSRDPFGDDDEKGASMPVKIDVDLSLTAFANSKRYFEHKKQSSQKQMRTLEAGEKVSSSRKFHFPLLFISN